ncbi:MAG: AgmX/PglI C-terminal domain-containing protein, partial [Pseudomonadota bacterium]
MTNKPTASPETQPKILRIGVIQAGKIIEERLIRRHESVTIGASARNTIVVPASTLPRTYTLFEIQGEKYSLLFTEDMDGRVSVQNQVLPLAHVREKKMAEETKRRGTKKPLFKLPLTEKSRGKVLLGEVTLLFQFVAPPPIQPRPQLPPSIRGSFFDKMDWTLASSFIVVAVINLTFLIYLHGVEIPRKLSPDIVPDSFAEYLPTIEQPKVLDISKLTKLGEKKVEKVAEKEGAKTAGKKNAGKPKQAPVCDADCQAAKAEERRARLAQQVSRMGALALLGHMGKGSSGSATRDLLNQGDPGTEAVKAFRGVGGLTTSGRGRGGDLTGKGGGGTGEGVDIGNLGGRVGGPGAVGTGGMVVERVPKGEVTSRNIDIEGTMDSDQVTKTIRRGMAAVRSCYQRALKRNPKLSGKISVRIAINAMGGVTRVEIDSDTIGDAQVAACIKGYAARWR